MVAEGSGFQIHFSNDFTAYGFVYAIFTNPIWQEYAKGAVFLKMPIMHMLLFCNVNSDQVTGFTQ